MYADDEVSLYKSGYGSAASLGSKAGFRRRRRVNICAVAMCLFVPWILFSLVYAAMSFSLHFKHPAMTYLIDAVAAILVIASAYLAFDAVWKMLYEDPDREPTWFVFLFVTMTIAWIGGMVLGDMNYVNNFEPYYDLKNLNSYTNVNPMKSKGEQYMDASSIGFAPGSHIDVKKSMSFKNNELYCAAPILGSESTNTSYDFWAVGLNCCGSNGEDFNCGDVKSTNARAGLRLMRDDQRAFYRLAVQQAESKFNIKATHPLFFHWTQDPDQDTENFKEDGLKYYVVGMFAHFALQLFLVVCAVTWLSKA